MSIPEAGVPVARSRKRRAVLLLLVLGLGVGVVGAPFAVGTRTVSEFLDHRALSAMARVALRRPSGGATQPLLPYDRGHALALFNRQMYKDYARLLDEDLRALDR